MTGLHTRASAAGTVGVPIGVLDCVSAVPGGAPITWKRSWVESAAMACSLRFRPHRIIGRWADSPPPASSSWSTSQPRAAVILRTGMQREHAVVEHQIDPRPRNERGQLLEQFQRLEHELPSAVRPRKTSA